MKNIFILFICFAYGVSFAQKINSSDREKIYDTYEETSKPYMEAMTSYSNKEKDLEKAKLNRANFVMVEAKLKYALTKFDKNLKKSDLKNVSHFVDLLNQKIKEEFKSPDDFVLPEKFYQEASSKVLNDFKK